MYDRGRQPSEGQGRVVHIVFNGFSIKCFPRPCGVGNLVVKLLETLWAYSGNIGSSAPSIISITILIEYLEDCKRENIFRIKRT